MKLKKGKYYIGDPGYIFGNSWMDILHKTDFFDGDDCKIDGKPVFVAGTTDGDGTFTDNYGREYAIDTGMLGILPISLLNKDKVYTRKQIEESDNMHIVEFAEDFEADKIGRVYRFGHVEIDEEYEEEEEECDCRCHY